VLSVGAITYCLNGPRATWQHRSLEGGAGVQPYAQGYVASQELVSCGGGAGVRP
jgi:hypothetical protein